MITRPSSASTVSILTSATFLMAVALAPVSARAQSTAEGKTVADGIYSDIQATRGQQFYESSCVRCHRSDLSGAEGPPLRGDRFSKDYAGKDLKVFYDKVANTMPGAAPASLSENVYLDIVAHVLRENGFPAGASELTRDSVAGVRVMASRPKPLPPVEDFSYVEAVGCLTAGPGDAWLLTNASEPTSARAEQPVATPPPDKALGSGTFRLLDARAYNPGARQGHKVYVRGLLVKMPSESRMTISALETVAGSCGS
ncbi:MAG: cytochrome c [Acidobacteriota bacterium]